MAHAAALAAQANAACTLLRMGLGDDDERKKAGPGMTARNIKGREEENVQCAPAKPKPKPAQSSGSCTKELIPFPSVA